MEGIGSAAIEEKVLRRLERKLAVLTKVNVLGQRVVTVCSYCSGENVARSFKSAPAQKLVSTSLAIINARVAPDSPSSWIESTSRRSSESNWVEIAFRALGRLSDTMRILPLWGAGTLVTFRTGDAVLERYLPRRNAHLRCGVRMKAILGGMLLWRKHTHERQTRVQ
jgi:hypothetical protein